MGFGTADETVNTPAGAAAADEAEVAEAEAWVFGNICCCQHIFLVAPAPVAVAYAFYLLATVSVSLLLLYNNFDDGRYGTRRFGRAPVSSPCCKLRWISLLLTVECAHTHTHTAPVEHTRSTVCLLYIFTPVPSAVGAKLFII